MYIINIKTLIRIKLIVSSLFKPLLENYSLGAPDASFPVRNSQPAQCPLNLNNVEK